MKVYSSWSHRHIFTGITLLLLLALALAACGGSNTASPAPGGATPTTGSSSSSNATPTPVPGIKLGPQPCPTAVQNPAYWNAQVHTQAGVTSIAKVQCANLMGTTSLQALVTVGYEGTGHILDVYVFNNITDPSPTQIFKLLSLYKGDAKISGYNTLLTAEVDQDSSVNQGQPNAALQLDLFREFKWSDSAQTLVQIAFPAFFPDLTRYQAEADQAQVNQGHDPWKLSAIQTAQALAANDHLLHWGPNAQATIVSGSGNQDSSAVVDVKSPNRGGNTIEVTMSRLEGNTNGGIWEVTSVTTKGLTISAPQGTNLLSNPVPVNGTGPAFEGKIGTVVVLDHLYTDIGHADARGATGTGNTSFSTHVSYASSFRTGAQEGLVVLYSYSQADGSIAGAVMVKALLAA